MVSLKQAPKNIKPLRSSQNYSNHYDIVHIELGLHLMGLGFLRNHWISSLLPKKVISAAVIFCFGSLRTIQNHFQHTCHTYIIE